MNRRIVEGDAEKMMDVSIFMSTVASLVTDDLTEQGTDGNPFLNPYRLEGLMRGLKMAADSLADRSEWLTERVEEEEMDELEQREKAQAALARRQGRDNNLASNVGAKCGTQHAA